MRRPCALAAHMYCYADHAANTSTRKKKSLRSHVTQRHACATAGSKTVAGKSRGGRSWKLLLNTEKTVRTIWVWSQGTVSMFRTTLRGCLEKNKAAASSRRAFTTRPSVVGFLTYTTQKRSLDISTVHPTSPTWPSYTMLYINLAIIKSS